MIGKRKAVAGAILAAGLVASVVVVRGLACGPGGGARLRPATEREWAMPFTCGKCGHAFVGYEVSLEPGTTPRSRKLRYRRPGDEAWVPETEAAAVAKIKRVVCPKCGAGMRRLTLDHGKIPGEGP